MSQRPCTTCPAAELTRGTLSQNKHDIRCHIAGLLRPAADSPCIGEYEKCKIWVAERDGELAGKARKREKKMIPAGNL